MITLHDKTFEPYLSAAEIDAINQKLAAQVYKKYKNETPIFIGVLNGVVRFVSDFLKHYEGNCEVSFIKLSSYQGTETTHDVKRQVDLYCDITDRHVIVLEDIVDTGNTLVEIIKLFNEHNPKSLEVATLFLKPDVYNKDIPIAYVGLEIPNKFIVGYGLDYDELGRNLNEVYQLKV